MAQLSGTGRLADDLYLMAHHDVSGKPYLQPRAVGLGLAAALLAELVLAGNVRTRHGEVMVSDGVPPEDGLARLVLGQLAGEREHHPAREWLLFLGRTAAGDVARRLEQAGYLVQASARRRGRAQRWAPVDADCAFAPLARVQSVLKTSRPVTVYGAVLAGLAVACGLGPRLQMYGPPRSRDCLSDAVRQLSPDLRELIAQTQAAVDSALLAARV